MKRTTLKLLPILLFIILYSCSSEDPATDTGGNSKPQRRILRIEKTILNKYNESSTSIETFSYDKQGRWIKSEISDGYSSKAKTLSYSGNSIVYDDGYNVTTFKVNNNIITSRDEDGKLDNYRYSNGYLIGISSDYADFEYSNGNLIKSAEDGTYTITYTDYPDMIGFSIFEPSYNDGAIEVYPNNPLYQFGYFGNKSKNLIQSIKGSYSTNLTYSYSFDDDGYVIEMVEKGSYFGTVTYKFSYE